MHTFFINTSNKDLSDYDILFDIHYENRTLVSLNCHINDWFGKEKGYLACVKKMSSMIDGYVEINNAFNLILYVDLEQFEAFKIAVIGDNTDEDVNVAYIQTVKKLYKRLVADTVCKALVDSGRMPQNVLIMFGGESFRDIASGDYLRESESAVLKLLGMPDEETVSNALKSISNTSQDRIGELKQKLSSEFGSCVIPDGLQIYDKELEIWYTELGYNGNFKNAISNFCDCVVKVKDYSRKGLKIEEVFCPYDSYASTINKSVYAVSILNILFHLLKCVENQSVYLASKDDEKEAPELIPYRAYTVDEIAAILTRKQSLFKNSLSYIKNIPELYTKLGLSPQLNGFNHEKFGLDEHGKGEIEFEVIEKSERQSDSNNIESDAAHSQSNYDEIKVGAIDKELSAKGKLMRSLFIQNNYNPFDYTLIDLSADAEKSGADPESYIKCAMKVRKGHITYIDKLRHHIKGVLSNYAGNSKENRRALLKSEECGYSNGSPETKPLETVLLVSDVAYSEMLNRYLELCASRSVRVTDIQEQCDWFVSRVSQIEESLKKLKTVGAIFLPSVLLMYAPFIILQFSAIVSNPLTFLTALGSLAAPLALAYGVFGIVAARQKRKYEQALREFLDKSKEVLDENAEVAKSYDLLLSYAIPGLRWVYDYKLDTKFCFERCTAASAKIEHHRMKLLERLEAIANILRDLEYVGNTDFEQRSEEKSDIDLNSSFCSGKKNIEIYSIIDSDFLMNRD